MSLPGSYDRWKTWHPWEDDGHDPDCPAHEDQPRVCECDDKEEDHDEHGSCLECAALFDKPEDRCQEYREVEPDCECDDIRRNRKAEAAEDRRDYERDKGD